MGDRWLYDPDRRGRSQSLSSMGSIAIITSSVYLYVVPWMTRYPRICETLVPLDRGLYLLEVLLEGPAELGARLLHGARLLPGLYLYIGSAGGSGGLRGRVCRHVRFKVRGSKPRWHVDWLLAHGTVPGAYLLPGRWGPESEEGLSEFLSRSIEEAHPRFGSSDTRSSTHLYRSPGPPGSLIVLLRREHDCAWTYVDLDRSIPRRSHRRPSHGSGMGKRGGTASSI